ncbi:ArsC/Spx/MgsR family protein [Lactococcus petauri]|uniref:ArsC/Spx/MgsR family protein n=1 Tax=Lactococcus petauri TaxID=1940789 RepID=UPI00385389B0
MIKIYYRRQCHSSKQAIQWLKKHEIPFELITINKLPKEELLRLLPLTDRGFNTFLRRPGKDGGDIQFLTTKLMGLKYNDAVEFLHKTPQLLKTPLIVEEDKFFIGYNNEEIRQFIPSVQRQRKLW